MRCHPFGVKTFQGVALGYAVPRLRGEVGKLAGDVDGEVLRRIPTVQAILDSCQVVVEPGLAGLDLSHLYSEAS